MGPCREPTRGVRTVGLLPVQGPASRPRRTQKRRRGGYFLRCDGCFVASAPTSAASTYHKIPRNCDFHTFPEKAPAKTGRRKRFGLRSPLESAEHLQHVRDVVFRVGGVDLEADGFFAPGDYRVGEAHPQDAVLKEVLYQALGAGGFFSADCQGSLLVFQLAGAAQ